VSALQPVSFRKGREYLPRLSPPRVIGRQNSRYYTDAEKAIIRKHYPTGGAGACKPSLPRRSHTSIYYQARRLGLYFNGSIGGPKKRFLPPSGIDDRIRAAWPLLKGRGAVAGLADELGVARTWLSSRALKLGLTNPHKKEPPWTAAENALMRKVPLHDPKKCSAIFREHGFRRTATAIMVRATRLEISRRTHTSFSGTKVARLLGMDNKTVTQWCVRGELKAKRRGTKRLPQQGGDVWDIAPKVLRQFILDNLERIDIRKVEKFAFVDLLVRTEDVKEEAKSQRKHCKASRRTRARSQSRAPIRRSKPARAKQTPRKKTRR
jgi:hypothetical protein